MVQNSRGHSAANLTKVHILVEVINHEANFIQCLGGCISRFVLRLFLLAFVAMHIAQRTNYGRPRDALLLVSVGAGAQLPPHVRRQPALLQITGEGTKGGHADSV